MDDGSALRQGRRATRLVTAAFIWSIGLILAALFVPVQGQAVTTPDGPTLTTLTLVHQKGGWVLIPVAVPALASAVVAAALWMGRSRRSRASGPVAWSATGVLAAFALLSIPSIGFFIVPVVALLAWATRVSPAAPTSSRRAAAQRSAGTSASSGTPLY
jgi:hypothetical protein